MEEWFRLLFSSVMESEHESMSNEGTSTDGPDNGMDLRVSKPLLATALKSLLDVYKSSGHRNVIQKFEKLDNILTHSP